MEIEMRQRSSIVLSKKIDFETTVWVFNTILHYGSAE